MIIYGTQTDRLSDPYNLKTNFGTVPVVETAAVVQPVYVSSSFDDIHYPETNINDGNPTSVWGTAVSGGQEWLFVDLLSMQDINGYRLHWNNQYFARDYAIIYSHDSHDWTFYHHELNGDGDIDEVINTTAVQARYIGVLLNSGPEAIYALKEFEILQK